MAESLSPLDKMNELLLSFLECPVCLSFMEPPIWQCDNGHNVCSKCRPRLFNCPVCKQGQPRARNIALEQLCEAAVYPCENASAGCDQKTLHTSRVQHSLACPYRPYKCPVRDCEWKGRRSDILSHALEAHALLRSKKGNMKLSIPSEIVTQGIQVRLDNHGHVHEEYGDDYDHVRFVTAYDEIFFFFLKISYRLNGLYIAVQYVGPEENAKNYAFEVKFSRDDTPEKITSSHFTCKDVESVGTILCPPKCAHFYIESMKTFFVDAKLQINVEIMKL